MKTKTDTPAPAEPGAAVAGDELAALEAAAIADAPPPPADPDAPPEPPEVPTAEVLAMLYGPMADVIAPNWKITREECKTLADAHALVIDKYWPGGMNTMGPELTALIMTLAIVGPRIAMKKPMRLEKKADAAEATVTAG